MKIVLTIKELTVAGGAERSFVELATNLSQRGHCVTVAVYDRKDRLNKNSYYPLDNKIKLSNLYKRNIYYLFYKIQTVLKTSFTAISLMSNPTESQLLWSKKLKVKRYKSYFLNENPDVVISFLPNTFVDVYLALKKTSIQFVAAHRNDPEKDFTSITCKTDAEKKLRFDAVKNAAANTVLFDEYKRFFPESLQNSFYVIPNPVYPAKEENLAQHNQAKDTYIILSVGRLTDIKNHQLLIRSFAILADQYPNWQIKIFGDGPKRAHLDDLIHTLNLSDRIHLMGVKPSIFEEYANADIFALPSLFEGFPRALSEAMAHGLPSVVLKKCTGCRNLILKSTGGYVAQDDPEDYALRLEKLMCNPHKRKMMGLDARNYIITTYTPDMVYDLWEQLIERITENENTGISAFRKKIAARI